jgi:hypothetical protein
MILCSGRPAEMLAAFFVFVMPAKARIHVAVIPAKAGIHVTVIPAKAGIHFAFVFVLSVR